MAVAGRPKLVAGVRIEELRRAVGKTADGAVRARLRVEIAGLLRAHGDISGALGELRRAAVEAPGSSGVRLDLLSAASALPATDRAWLLSETSQIAKGETPVWTATAGEAHLAAGQPAQAVRVWLALAADNRVPVYRRRVAARRAEEAAAALSPRERLAALRARAALGSGRDRLAFLGRALALADDDSVDREARLGLVAAWLEGGGPPARIEPLLDLVDAGDSPAPGRAPDRESDDDSRAEDVVRLRREVARRRARPRPPEAAPRPARPTPSAPTKDDPMARAVGAARAGRGVQARRLAERAVRTEPPGPELAGRVGAVDAALRHAGLVEQALLLRRAGLEGIPPGELAAPLTALVAEADAAGLTALAASWRADLSPPKDARAATPPRAPGRAPASPADFYLAAQRSLVHLPPGGDPAPVLAMLARAVAGHPGADAALALGDRLLRGARPKGDGKSEGEGENEGKADARTRRQGEVRNDVHLIELLRAAFRAEDLPSRRARLADRLATALEADGDATGALALLERAIGGLPMEGATRLRGRRARLLRELGKVRELAAALAADADAYKGAARRAALAERADLLDAAGEPERALAERLSALDEAPGELGVLAPARRRLESTGRFDQSLKLATRAIRHVTDRGEKLKLLRDVALLSEKATRDRRVVASAWLAVLELDPDDLAAAEAAERLLVAAADWERYADLLAWAAARTGTGPAAGGGPADAGARRASLLWRLAELRRTRLGQPDEALRLYRALATPGAPSPGIPRSGRAPAMREVPSAAAGSAPPDARPERLLELHTARIAVAPGPAERAKAYLDRGLVLFEQLGRFSEAESDVSRALDMDPRNVDVILAFERVCERTGRWAELEQSFKQKAAVVAPAAASRLWFGIARVAERKDDMMGAREAYERAAAMDPALVEPVIALRKLASRRTDWPEVARLYELELALARGDDDERTRLSVELASIVGDRLGDSNRALELLDHAGASQISDPRTLDLYFRHNLAAERPAAERRWDVAGQTLERLLAIGNEPPDAADRYFRVGVAAEAAGQSDQALVFYSRAYSRSPNYRPTLERLSQLCFEKGQWDNAWRATEGLLERHRPNLGSAEIGDLLVRSALCDVHIGQRLGAMARLASLVEAGSGARDVADSWAAMRIEPRLLGGLEGDRRERVVRRLREALAIPDSRLQVARRQAWEILGAMAVVEQRWADAREALDRLAADPGASSSDRCGYLLAAGDIAGNMQKDAEAAARFYARARATNGGDPRLTGRIALKPARPPTKDEGAPTPPPAPGDRTDGRDPSSHDEPGS